MRVVNLAKRPFVNRRPVVRMAALLWLLGGALLATNIFLYTSYWRGTADNRALLAESEQALRQAEKRLEEQDRQLTSLDLRSMNREAAFLNGLISQRTFPWSALFDHLERVTPMDVRLVTVQPAVHLAGSEQSSGSSRRQSRRRASASVWDSSGIAADQGDGPDEVELRFSGWSKTEEALTEFIDTLYQDPSFRRILLRNEALENEGGQQSIRFNLEVLFLTGLAESEAVAEPQVAKAEGPEDTPPQIPGKGSEPEEEARQADAAGSPSSDNESTRATAPQQVSSNGSTPAVGEEVLAAGREGSRREEEVAARLVKVLEEDEEPKIDQEAEEESEEDAVSRSRRQRLEALRERSRARAELRNRRQTQAEEAGRRSAAAAGIQFGPGAVVGGGEDPETGNVPGQPGGGEGNLGNQGGGTQGGPSGLPKGPASSTPGVSWLVPEWMPRLDDFGLALGLLGEKESEG